MEEMHYIDCYSTKKEPAAAEQRATDNWGYFEAKRDESVFFRTALSTAEDTIADLKAKLVNAEHAITNLRTKSTIVESNSTDAVVKAFCLRARRIMDSPSVPPGDRFLNARGQASKRKVTDHKARKALNRFRVPSQGRLLPPMTKSQASNYFRATLSTKASRVPSWNHLPNIGMHSLVAKREFLLVHHLRKLLRHAPVHQHLKATTNQSTIGLRRTL
ncbi:uncharacterized protein BDZ99DRAFT_527945 [Mytilinidion resinicola]|uniref:Uncharacterized protein n=1 Tax=Mytilinidion resinicola TaxID=574789 RepID=A0A6A6Y1W0_9PEZI|nr:uncharacterized protein BDZ99DRAFT_527945 [Mytilinidion resinicola]KAF2801994.1 hypothetical protein BDZ99DRAFT_527945 [Mytilinidion resinicola]